MKVDPNTIPMLAIEFRCADGSAFKRDWCLNDADADRMPPVETFEVIPDWLDNPRQSWSNPLDPVKYSGDVKPGREDEARQFVEELDAAGSIPPEGSDQ